MDIYLQAKTKFTITGSGSGATDISTVLGTPYLCVNGTPIDWAPVGQKTLFIPKKLKKNGKYLSLNNYFDILSNDDKGSYLMSQFYNNEAMSIEDNSAEEILDATNEMFLRLEEVYKESDEDRARQEKYQEIHSKSPQFGESKTPICREFLKSNQWFIE